MPDCGRSQRGFERPERAQSRPHLTNAMQISQ
jgi:hypothetical protein